jgi:CHAD domain-containing protein
MSRKYRLKKRERIPDGVVRIAEGRIDHAIDELRGDSESSPEEGVHEARKDMKKLRSLLRLTRGEIGGETYRRENATFRDAAGELAGVRDADVMLATLDGLDRRYPEELPADAAGGLRVALEAHKIRTSAGARGQASKAAIETLTEARKRVAAWPLDHDDFDTLEPGLRRIYRQGRRAFLAARKEPTTEHLHEWRKRVKDLWYHCSILQNTWKPVMSSLADEAHELSDRLGDDHDLAVLQSWAQEHVAEHAGTLEELVQRRRAELQAEAFAYGARLYVDKPRVFAARVERWWDASAGAAPAEPAHH